MTQQRRVISDLIRKSPRHMTAEQIFREARKTLPSIAVGTVYRNLGRMEEDGEIMRVEIPGEPDRFDKNSIPHHHCICEKCGEVYDVPVTDLTERLRAETGLEIVSYDLTLRIRCACCAKNNV